MNWDKYFLEQARHISTASKDPSTKVGAVVVDPKRRVVSQGYNGFARGISDTEDRLNNRDVKYRLVIHAETNALLFGGNMDGCTIYVWPMMPCASCASKCIQKGIKRVVSVRNDNPRWVDDFKLSMQIFREADVSLTIYENDFSSILPDF